MENKEPKKKYFSGRLVDRSGKYPPVEINGEIVKVKVRTPDGKEVFCTGVKKEDGEIEIFIDGLPQEGIIFQRYSAVLSKKESGKKSKTSGKNKAAEEETFLVPSFCVSKDAYFNAQPSALTLFDGVADYAADKGKDIDAAIDAAVEKYASLMGKAEGNIIRKADKLLRGGTGEVLYTRIEWKNFFEKLVFLGVCKFFYDQHKELFDLKHRVPRPKGAKYYVDIPISQITNLIYQTTKATNQNKARVLQALEDLSTRTASIEIRKKGSKHPEISIVSGLWTFGNEVLTDEKTKARIYQLTMEKFFYSELERGGYIKLPADFFALLKGNKNEIAVNSFLYLNGQFSFCRMNTGAPVVEVEERKFRDIVSANIKFKRGGREDNLFRKALEFLKEKNIVKNFRRFKKDGSFWLHFEEGDIYTNEPRKKETSTEPAPTK